MLIAAWVVFAALGGAKQHPVALNAGVIGGLTALWGIFAALSGWNHQRILVAALAVAGLGGAALFINLGGWKMLGSKAQDDMTIQAPITEIRVANLGDGSAEIRRDAAPGVRIHRTLYYLTPGAPARRHLARRRNRALPGQRRRVRGGGELCR